MPAKNPIAAELKELVKLAAPLAAIYAGSQLMSFVDTAVVGRLGAEALGGVGLAHSLFMVITVVGMGIMMGLDPLVTQALGAGAPGRARRLFWQGIWLSLGLGALLMIPVAVAAPLFEPLGIAPAIAAQARPFALWRATGVIPLLAFVATRSHLQALGVTRPMVWGIVLGNLANLAAGLLLVFGGASLPEWTGPLRRTPAIGASGAAIATTLTTLLQLGIAALAVGKLPAGDAGPVSIRPRSADLKLALRIGLPIGLQMGAEVGVFALVAFLSGRLGTQSLASHQIALTLASFTFTVSLGIGAAGAVRVGRAIGAQDPVATRRGGLTAFGAGAAFMSLGALSFLLFPSPLASLLSNRPEVVAAAVPLIAVAAFFQLSDGTQAIGAGVLRGAGDTRFPFLANLVGHYLIGLPVALFLGFRGGLGVVGLWWGLCAGLTAVGLALLGRFWRLSARPIERVEARAAD